MGNLQLMMFLIAIYYCFYIEVAFHRFTKNDDSKWNDWLIMHQVFDLLYLILCFFIFKWYVAITIIIIGILLTGTLNKRIGHKIDTIIFNHQKIAIILNGVLWHYFSYPYTSKLLDYIFD